MIKVRLYSLVGPPPIKYTIAGTITWDGEKLTGDTFVANETIKEQKCWAPDGQPGAPGRRHITADDPEAWLHALPFNLHGSYFYAEEVTE